MNSVLAYSIRSALTGSMRVVRRAGIHAESAPAKTTAAADPGIGLRAGGLHLGKAVDPGSGWRPEPAAVRSRGGAGRPNVRFRTAQTATNRPSSPYPSGLNNTPSMTLKDGGVGADGDGQGRDHGQSRAGCGEEGTKRRFELAPGTYSSRSRGTNRAAIGFPDSPPKSG